MAQQTAMQQLIKWMEDKSEVIPFDQENCYDKAIELLQMEKEQIINAYDKISMLTAEQYYTETYKNNI